LELRARRPDLVAFLEIGVETAKGLDETARAWLHGGAPVTWHFLDVNLDEPEDFDPEWLAAVRAGVAAARPAWMCGDAGMWHFGPRDRAHMLLLPPVLTADAADAMAEGIVRLRDLVGLEVLPENPPGTLFVGDMHLCNFYARVAEKADTGLLLDVAHLAVYQRVTGKTWDDGLDAIPWDRVTEVHVAGGTVRNCEGFAWVDDDHGAEPLAETWRLLEVVAARARALKAVVVECERISLERAIPLLERVRDLVAPAWA
jgi:uncharacterized protein (UPF0276 family)